MKRHLLTTLFICFYIIANATDYYIDSQNGNDNNAGTSESAAWKTFVNVNDKLFNPGDKILLRKNGVWEGSLAPKGSGTKENPITIGVWGEGERPRINGKGQVNATIYIRNASYWIVQGLEITNTAAERGNTYRNGILFENDGAGELYGIVIRDNHVHHVTCSFRYLNGVDPHQYGGISVSVSHTSKGTDKYRDILIEGNTVEYSGRTGIVVWDYTWAEPNQSTTGVVIRGNTVREIDSDGILTFGCDGALIEYNYAEGCGAYREDDGFNGAAAIWATRGRNCIIQYNEACHTYKLEGNADGMGFDHDLDCYDCVIQYNYSHDNEGGFVLIIDASNSTNNIVRYNISQNDKERVIMIAGGVTPHTQIYNNVFYIGEGLDTKIIDHLWDEGGDVNAPWIFKNNIIINHGTGGYSIPGTGGIFLNNLYWGNHHPTEPDEINKITRDPMLMAPGTGKKGLESLEGYKLHKKSPARKAGTLIDHNGGKDFWGNKLPLYETPSIGVHQVDK
ncbi:MAG: right-handed parallel beta-helix repeat-containing protein [Proteiniphilum sp.]|uniref:right-handed parallel beta-helix repeat-containing protein n=1 Tax=Proteiniphilum sp. TaxID=1926877 RepID=UPI002B2041F9|nr:right-handed parallel beta-helix repeat-containing protein [Proteiniphilum sp.]MEA5129533.1 right-handed parallel beta-helix repeat-containing protein [Proteiniphilum sp.]